MLRNYLTIAFRNIRKYRGYSLINILGLAIGIACCVLIMLFVRDELGYDRFHDHADRIYRMVSSSSSETGVQKFARTAPLLGPTLMQAFPEIERAVRFKTYGGIMAYRDRSFYESEGLYFVDNGVFDMLTFPLRAGDPDQALREPYSMVITEGIAQKYFGNDNPIGKTITFRDSLDFTITGLLAPIPANSHIQFDILCSFSTLNHMVPQAWLQTWQSNTYYTYILMREQTQIAPFQAKLPAFVDRNITPELDPDVRYTLMLQPVTDIHLRSDYQHDLHAGGDLASIYLFSAINCAIYGRWIWDLIRNTS